MGYEVNDWRLISSDSQLLIHISNWMYKLESRRMWAALMIPFKFYQ